MKKITTVIVASVLVIAVFVSFMMFKISNTDDPDAILSNFFNLSQSVNRPISVSEIVRQVEGANNGGEVSEDPDGSGKPSVPSVGDGSNPSTGVSSKTWVEIVDSVHKQWGGAGWGYDETHDGIRCDCSGFVSYCLYVAGYTNVKQVAWSATMATELERMGISKVTGSYSTDLQPGDILIYPGHVEVFASYNDTGAMLVWNWGSPDTIASLYPTGVDASTVNSTTPSGHLPTNVGSAYRVERVPANSSGGINSGDPNAHTVFVDAGHGCQYNDRNNPGPYGWATVGANGEADWAPSLTDLLASELSSRGYNVIRIEDCTWGDGTQMTRSLAGNTGRGKMAEQYADIGIQIHYDDVNGNATGWHVIYGEQSGSGNLAKGISSGISSYVTAVPVNAAYAGGVSHRTDLALSKTSATSEPFILVECGFGCPGKSDYDALRDTAVLKQFAKGIADGVDDYFGMR